MSHHESPAFCYKNNNLIFFRFFVATRSQMHSFHRDIMVTSVVTRGDSNRDLSFSFLFNYQSCSRRFYLNQHRG